MDKIHELYKPNYWNEYSSDVFITIVIIGGVLYWVGKSNFDTALKQIRHDWKNKRCNPLLMPFAGLIVPKEGESTFGTTADNFNYCIQMEAGQVMHTVMMPLEMVMFSLILGMDMFIQSLLNFMDFMAWMRDQIGGYATMMYDKMLNIIVPILYMVLKIRDTIGKMNGIITVMFYNVINTYNIMVSGVLNIGNIIISLLIVLITSMVALIIFAFIMMFIPFSFFCKT